MLNLVRPDPRLLNLVRVGPHLLKLVRAGCCLLNLVRAGRLIIDGHCSGGYGHVSAVSALSVVAAVLARDDPSPPSAGLIVELSLVRGQCLCLGHIFLRLGWLKSREVFYDCMGGDDREHHHRRKCWRKPLSFLGHQGHASARPFGASWFLGSQPRTMCKKAKQRPTPAAVVMAVQRRHGALQSVNGPLS